MNANAFSHDTKFGNTENRVHAHVAQRMKELREAKIMPPASMMHLMNEVEVEIFDEIINEVPLIEWTPSRIRLAASWARCQYRYDVHFEQYVQHGGITGDFDEKIHADVKIMNQLATMVLRYRKQLGMVYPSIYGGHSPASSRRDKIGALIEEAEEAYAEPEEKNPNDIRQLIAMPAGR